MGTVRALASVLLAMVGFMHVYAEGTAREAANVTAAEKATVPQPPLAHREDPGEGDEAQIEAFIRSNGTGTGKNSAPVVQPPLANLSLVADGAVPVEPPPKHIDPDEPVPAPHVAAHGPVGVRDEGEQADGVHNAGRDQDAGRDAENEVEGPLGAENNRDAVRTDARAPEAWVAESKELKREIERLRETEAETRKTVEDLIQDNDMLRDEAALGAESSKDRENAVRKELTASLDEQRKAFEELLEEKKLLASILRDEQNTLRDLQERIQNPDLGLWIKRRTERAAILLENPETDAMAYYAKQYMQPKIKKMRHRLDILERRVERTVDHLLPAQYGGVVALLLSFALVGFPIVVSGYAMLSLTKTVSLRQYVLIGNVFCMAFAFGLCAAEVMLWQDPLQTLYEASENMFMMMQIALALVYPAFLVLIAMTVLKARDDEDMFVFGCELVFYFMVAINYHSHVWKPAMLGRNIQSTGMMYVVYLVDFMAMTALTVSSSRVSTMARLPPPVTESAGAGSLGDRLGSPAGMQGAVSRLTGGLVGSGGGAAGKDE